ncbi:MAG: C10 family peptidase [Bacteroidaceae bacterium]|nr:C10 family peptidase [Bacteroidaceae bacterium]
MATLMQHCGTALQMDYNRSGAGGSSAYNVSVAEALRLYFGYDSDVCYVQRHHYSYLEWVGMIYAELAAQRPVILGGQSAGGGHSFVCDGFDADDFFHINWGWGGQSDGYFRLTALNPYEQGIGGSSTLDGFSYGQDAVVGIQRAQDETDTRERLYVEALQFGASDTERQKTFTRASSDEPFTAMKFYYTLWHYRFEPATFDYALQLTDAGGEVLETLVLGTDIEMSGFNASRKETTKELTMGAGLSDGTYTLKMVCRLADSDGDYVDCYYADRFQMTAVISENTLVLTAAMLSSTMPTLRGITVEGDLLQGHEQEVYVLLTAGATDFHDNVFLVVNSKLVMGKVVEITAGETATVRFVFTPTTEGSNILRIAARSKTKYIGKEQEVTITATDDTDKIDMSFNAVIDNQQQDGTLYDNALRLTVTATNPSEENSYAGVMNCSLRKWGQADDAWTFTSELQSRPLAVEKHGSTTVGFAFDGLERGARYSARITYRRTNGTASIADAVHVGYDAESGCGTLLTSAGYSLGAADGTVDVCPPAAEIAAGDAAYVDLRAMDDLTGVSFTVGSNPNCLYLLSDDAAVPKALQGCNTLCGSAADGIALADGHDFFTPIAFTASRISYTRTFERAAAGTSGWNTLCLPFTAATVTVADGTSGGKSVDWFRSSDDSGKHFWLKALVDDGEGYVCFDHAGTFTANTPYIIAVPGDTWGDAWQMTGREVTFAATDAAVEATSAVEAVISGDSYKFCGTTVGRTLANAYALDNDGSTFFLQTAATVEPFRAWFEDAQVSSLLMPALRIRDRHANAIAST